MDKREKLPFIHSANNFKHLLCTSLYARVLGMGAPEVSASANTTAPHGRKARVLQGPALAAFSLTWGPSLLRAERQPPEQDSGDGRKRGHLWKENRYEANPPPPDPGRGDKCLWPKCLTKGRNKVPRGGRPNPNPAQPPSKCFLIKEKPDTIRNNIPSHF